MGQTMKTMADVKYYEQGRVPGDFLPVQEAIQRQREWAIVRDSTAYASFLSPLRPTWHVIVNGVLVKTCRNRADAEWEMRGYLDGWYWIPWDVRPLPALL
jgi:hypothetical protein